MKIKVLTLFPHFYDHFCQTSIVKRALEQGKVSIEVIDLRTYGLTNYQQVDDQIYGGKGMLLRVDVLATAISEHRQEQTRTFLMGPKAPPLTQQQVYQLAQEPELLLVCGHYEGVDARVRKYVDGEISIGDYILSGGEVAALVVMDSVIRVLPGVIKGYSHTFESYNHGLLEEDQFTRPVEFQGDMVPLVLRSGHHRAITQYNQYSSLLNTYRYRPELLEQYQFNAETAITMAQVLVSEWEGETDD